MLYAVATSLSLVPRISLQRRLAERSLSLSHPDWDFNESLTAEAQKSLAVVLPGGTALSEIISCIRQKRGNLYCQKGALVELNRHRVEVFLCVFPPKKGTVRNHAMFIVDCPYVF